MKRCFLVFLFLFQTVLVFSKSTNQGLQTETYLHPMDGFTAYTLEQNEFVYNQTVSGLISGIPVPSWAWWGITDWLTAEIDFECLFGGVASFNFRFHLLQQDGLKPEMAYETMFQYLPYAFDGQIETNQPMKIIRSGLSWYHRLNLSWEMISQFYVHLSAGLIYQHSLTISNTNSLAYFGNSYMNHIYPDLSLSLDYRPANWVSLHLTMSYGSTFVYLDNVPRKVELMYGARFAPFFRSKMGFLNSFRIEIPAMYFYFPDSKELLATYIPLPQMAYLYWQWTF